MLLWLHFSTSCLDISSDQSLSLSAVNALSKFAKASASSLVSGQNFYFKSFG
jgi:hypothetical protein